MLNIHVHKMVRSYPNTEENPVNKTLFSVFSQLSKFFSHMKDKPDTKVIKGFHA